MDNTSPTENSTPVTFGNSVKNYMHYWVVGFKMFFNRYSKNKIVNTKVISKEEYKHYLILQFVVLPTIGALLGLCLVPMNHFWGSVLLLGGLFFYLHLWFCFPMALESRCLDCGVSPKKLIYLRLSIALISIVAFIAIPIACTEKAQAAGLWWIPVLAHLFVLAGAAIGLFLEKKEEAAKKNNTIVTSFSAFIIGLLVVGFIAMLAVGAKQQEENRIKSKNELKEQYNNLDSIQKEIIKSTQQKVFADVLKTDSVETAEN